MIAAYPRVLIKKNSTFKNSIWKKTTIVINWFGFDLPIGTEYKAFETDNFGYVWLKETVNNHRVWKE